MEISEKSDATDAAVAVLIDQIKNIDAKIIELQAERMACERLLLKARRMDLSVKDVNRKNSIDRIIVENVILERIRAANRPVDTIVLLKAAKNAKPDLKDSTFRSYLARMNERGLIVSKKRGYWGRP